MKNMSLKFNTMHAILLASCLGVSLPGLAEPDIMIQNVSVSQKAMLNILSTSKINLKFAIWFPQTADDVRNYFNYHKDVEVFQMMKYLNTHLGFGLDQEILERHSYFHDLPKVMQMYDLKLFGYKGWQPEIAEAFLRETLKVSVETIRENFPKNEFGNYEVDLATRLLFSFGLSDATIAKLYPEERVQKIILTELKDLRGQINHIEDLVKDKMARASYFDSLSSEEQAKIKFLEYISDFTVRTENKLAMLEYFKEFIKSSSMLEEHRELIEDYRSLKAETQEEKEKKKDFLDKNMDKIFVYVILEKEAGRDLIDRIGLDGLIELFKFSEFSYPRVLQDYVDNSRNNKTQRRKTLVPRTLNFGELILKEFKYQKEKLLGPLCIESAN